MLLTADKDFGQLVFRQGLVHSGVVLLRLAGLANATKAVSVSGNWRVTFTFVGKDADEVDYEDYH